MLLLKGLHKQLSLSSSIRYGNRKSVFENVRAVKNFNLFFAWSSVLKLKRCETQIYIYIYILNWALLYLRINQGKCWIEHSFLRALHSKQPLFCSPTDVHTIRRMAKLHAPYLRPSCAPLWLALEIKSVSSLRLIF
jgi:hypothetical protein